MNNVKAEREKQSAIDRVEQAAKTMKDRAAMCGSNRLCVGFEDRSGRDLFVDQLDASTRASRRNLVVGSALALFFAAGMLGGALSPNAVFGVTVDKPFIAPLALGLVVLYQMATFSYAIPGARASYSDAFKTARGFLDRVRTQEENLSEFLRTGKAHIWTAEVVEVGERLLAEVPAAVAEREKLLKTAQMRQWMELTLPLLMGWLAVLGCILAMGRSVAGSE